MPLPTVTASGGAQLISTADSLHVWSESYDRPSSDLLRIQNEIAVAVANGMRPYLAGEAAVPPHPSRFSTNPEANQLYWKGVYWRSSPKELPIGKQDLRVVRVGLSPLPLLQSAI